MVVLEGGGGVLMSEVPMYWAGSGDFLERRTLACIIVGLDDVVHQLKLL